MAGRLPGWLAMVLAFVLALTSCSIPASEPEPSPGAPEVAEQLVAALAAGEIGALPLTGDPEEAVLDHAQATGRLGGLRPEVSAGEIEYLDRTTARLPLQQSYHFPQGDWSFTSKATLRHIDGAWRIEWTTAIIHPQLTPTTRLSHQRIAAKRGPILDVNGAAIVEDRPVYRVGIDKPQIDQAQWDAAARGLANLLGLDADGYAAQVAAAGPLAFVVAITLREGQVPSAIEQIPGAAAFPTTLPLAPSASFARGLLGTVGEATAEVVEASDGAIQAGDVVGLSGLQAIHDEQLRGQPGHTITRIDRSAEQLAELPPPSPAPETTGDQAGSPASQPPSGGPTDELLFSVGAVNGTALQLTMDLGLQSQAEQVLADYGERLVMVVVLDRNSGGILAAASSPAAGAQPFATNGRYAPGSTMKVVTALALLRRGMTPDSIVECTPTAQINGRVFNNYNGYPAAFTGPITLRTALQQSCNTAFMNHAHGFGPGELAAAAASLGMGVDHDSGFDAFYGSVPPSDDPVVLAADSIGQGEVLMSPMAIAAEAASVAAGSTVVPHLLAGQPPTQPGEPLSATEAALLREMMAAVVTGGTLPQLQGVLEGGKSGTAEFGAENPPQTHGWVVGFAGDWAICAFDHDQRGDPGVPQAVVARMLGR